jgi:hypothetical protein
MGNWLITFRGGIHMVSASSRSRKTQQIVDYVILTVNADGKGSWTDTTGIVTNLADSAGATYFGTWPLTCNNGMSRTAKKIIGPGTVGLIRQDGYLAGYKVFDGHIHDTGSWIGGDGYTTIFPEQDWLHSSDIMAGPFGGYPGSVRSGQAIDPADARQILRALTKHERSEMDAKVRSYQRLSK